MTVIKNYKLNKIYINITNKAMKREEIVSNKGVFSGEGV